MIKDQVLQLLKLHNHELKKCHVDALYIFGSVARGEESPSSDIDILVSFDCPPTFDLYMDLKFFLETILNRRVDLVTQAGLRPELKKYIDQDLTRAA